METEKKLKDFDNSEEILKLWIKKFLPKAKLSGVCNRPFTRKLTMPAWLEVYWNMMDVYDMTEKEFQNYLENQIQNDKFCKICY